MPLSEEKYATDCIEFLREGIPPPSNQAKECFNIRENYLRGATEIYLLSRKINRQG